MESNCHEAREKDINDVFDDIVFSEDHIGSEAFEEGLIKGKKDGEIEGYHLGFHRGLELGTEIGFYKGLIKVILSNQIGVADKKNEKIDSLIEKLSWSLDAFPKENSKNVDLLKAMNEIRANVRKLNSLLKLNLSFPVYPVMSF